MTRETKVGIVVATSFLGLIGGVLAVKYFDPLERKNSQVGQTHADAGKKPAEEPVTPPMPDPKATATPAMLPGSAGATTAGEIVPLTPAAVTLPAPAPTPFVVPPDGALDIFAHFNDTKAARGIIGSGLLAKAATLMLATEKARQNQRGFDPNLRTAVGDTMPAGSSAIVPMIHLPKPADPPTGGITLPTPPPKPVDVPTSPNVVIVPTVPSTPGSPSLPTPDPAKPAGGVTIKFDPPDLPKPDAAPRPDPMPAKPDPMPAAPIILPTPPTKPNPDPMPAGPVILPTVPTTPKPDPMPPMPMNAKPADSPPLAPKPMDPPPVPLAPKPMDVKPIPADIKPTPAVPFEIKPTPPPSPVDVKPAPVTPFASDPNAVPQLGPAVAPAADPKVEPAATFDPNRTRPAGPREDADSYDEEWHRCRDGDTFAAISKAFYYTERYEQALRLYNLDRLGTENLRTERPMLRADQTVRVPPARILERKYAPAIPGLKGTPPGGAPAAGTSAPLATLGPVVADRSDGGNGAIEYEVTKPGMTLRDIAKEVLGNSDQWNRIFLLNRWVNSSEPVPVGAKIYVPRPSR